MNPEGEPTDQDNEPDEYGPACPIVADILRRPVESLPGDNGTSGG